MKEALCIHDEVPLNVSDLLAGIIPFFSRAVSVFLTHDAQPRSFALPKASSGLANVFFNAF
jgi:hypothetical protein